MAVLKYDRILRYLVTAQCNGPLRIGNAVGSKEEVLVHPVDNKPFVQASSITGVLRKYYMGFSGAKVEELFGAPEKEEKKGHKKTDKEEKSNWSRIKVSDGSFVDTDDNPLKLELRPHVKINRKTGSVDSAEILGTSEKSGQKFNLEYIGKGSAFQFILDVYAQAGDKLEEEMKKILAGMKDGNVQFGGKKSSGAGTVVLKELKFKEFNLKDADGRSHWIDVENFDAYEDILKDLKDSEQKSYAYRVLVSGKTEGSIQVKGIAVSEFGKNAPDSENIRNAIGEYIIPGSSFKGTARSQMEKIAAYLGKDQIVKETFGYTGQGEKDSKCGNIFFYDTVVGNKEENDMSVLAHRIHIDKFTGGVFNKGLFSEKNASGEVEFLVDIRDSETAEASLGLLILAMRDLAIGMMSVGNGYSTGKGIIDVKEIVITKARSENKAVIQFGKEQKMTDIDGIVEKALKALKGVDGK